MRKNRWRLQIEAKDNAGGRFRRTGHRRFNDWVAELFTSSDRFYDLYELGAKNIEPDFLDWKWKLGVTPEGTMIALPIDTGPTALYYRPICSGSRRRPNRKRSTRLARGINTSKPGRSAGAF